MLPLTKVTCSSCGKLFGIHPKALDRQLQCRGCGAVLRIAGKEKHAGQNRTASSMAIAEQRYRIRQKPSVPPPLPITEEVNPSPDTSAHTGPRFGTVLAGFAGCMVICFVLTWSARDWLVGRSHAGGAIKSVRQEKLIEEAVGLVVCSITSTSHAGDRREQIESFGTAFAVTTDGYLLTNAHVVRNTHNRMLIELPRVQDDKGIEYSQKASISVVFGASDQLSATIVALSDEYDLAILKVDRRDGPFFRLSRSSNIPRGTKVYSLGFPGAANDDLSEKDALHKALTSLLPAKTISAALRERDRIYTQTHGEVSRIVSETAGPTWLQHSAPMSWGNSGGPLVTDNGIVVGINTRLATARDVEVQDAAQLASVLFRLGLATKDQLSGLDLKNSTVPILGPGTFFSVIPAQARTVIEEHTGPIAWAH